MKYRFEIDRAKNGEFTWRLVSRNGNVVADGAETYKHKRSVKRMISRIAHYVDDTTEVDDLT